MTIGLAGCDNDNDSNKNQEPELVERACHVLLQRSEVPSALVEFAPEAAEN